MSRSLKLLSPLLNFASAATGSALSAATALSSIARASAPVANLPGAKTSLLTPCSAAGGGARGVTTAICSFFQLIDLCPRQLGEKVVLEASYECFEHSDVGRVLGPIPRL